MTETDTTLRQAVLDTIDTLGKTLTFRSNAGGGVGTYNPATGLYAAVPVETTYTYKTSPPQAYVRKWGDGDTVVEGSVEVLLPAQGLNATFEADYLRPEMRVDFDSKLWRTTAIEKIYSGDLVCAYRIIMSQHSGT